MIKVRGELWLDGQRVVQVRVVDAYSAGYAPSEMLVTVMNIYPAPQKFFVDEDLYDQEKSTVLMRLVANYPGAGVCHVQAFDTVGYPGQRMETCVNVDQIAEGLGELAQNGK